MVEDIVYAKACLMATLFWCCRTRLCKKVYIETSL
nr:MAG TPA: hypothetical protein [Caudoviricetes sp.]